jgi:hypothetical protein
VRKAFTGALTFVGILLVAAPRAARGDLVLIQDSNGFPGSGDAEEVARQKVTIGSEKLKVLDEHHGWALFVRLDEKKVREAWSTEKSFVEKPLSFYEGIRNARENTRREKVAEFKKAIDAAKTEQEKRQLKADLDRMGLREDLDTVARVDHFADDAKKMSVVVNNEKKDWKVEHYVVRENEGPPIFDLWIAPGIGRPDSVFKFYREIGTFSPQVVAKVMSLDGFPLEVTATVDDGNNKKTLHSRILEIRDEKTDPVEYDMPAGWKLVEGRTSPLAPVAKMKCAICGKECAPGSGDGSFLWRHPYTGQKYPVCSEKCRHDIIQKFTSEQRPANPDKPK